MRLNTAVRGFVVVVLSGSDWDESTSALQKGLSVIYLHFNGSHRAMRGAAMSVITAVSGFVLLTVTVVLGQYGWGVTYTSTPICAVKGSTVEIRCTYTYPSRQYNPYGVVRTFWFTKESNNEVVDLKTDPEYSGRVQYQCENNKCTLRITDLRGSDSAEYRFRFITNHEGGKYSGVPGVTLTVTDPQLQVHVRRSTVNSYSNWTELTCHNNCQLPDQSSYIWYWNGHKLSSEKQYLHLNTFDSVNSFNCAVKGYEQFPSPTVYAPKLPSVSVSPSAEIVEGSSVTLTCSSDANPAASYTWYKEDVINPLSYQIQHVFSSIRPSDSGKYYCTADNNLGQKRSESRTIDVKYAPKLPSVSVSPSAEIVEGSSVTLTCSSDANPAANYTWYKEDVINPLSYQNQHVFSSIRPSDSGKYYCTADNNLGQKRSERRTIDVKYAPKLPSVSVSPSAEIVEGSSVTLTCSSDANPAANYIWYKDNKVLATGQKDVYHFNSIKLENSGNYSCKSENQYGQKNSTSLSIDVQYPPRLPSVSVSPSGEIREGSSVTLTCSSDANPAANYTWYKEDEDSPKTSGHNFTISNIRPEHSGSYYCVAHNNRGTHNVTLQLTVREDFPLAAKLVVTGITLVVFLVIICLLVFFLLTKKKPSALFPVPGNRQDNNNKVSCTSPSQHTGKTESPPSNSEEDEELNYASVRFSTNQTDPIYYNIRSAGSRRQKVKEEDEHVEYAAVNFSSAPRNAHQESEEDPSELYSTVKKI
ncbi:B-cell receptor CD22 isoform X6 [Oreochromis niloticus]|uniref:B-cell receptor CD22 isoform X6 n=1 Tax=Oreochromis niloticus TaxID=8128 RepID=UPI000DF2362A|nr:B-cell receptor CD22 isoform X6 [Oreochromis niloticus]